MKIQRLCLVLSLATLGACTTQESTSPAAASGGDETLLEPADAAIPTEEEAAAAAAKKIDESNADAELESLKKELEGGR
jgi:hypothetical protein